MGFVEAGEVTTSYKEGPPGTSRPSTIAYREPAFIPTLSFPATELSLCPLLSSPRVAVQRVSIYPAFNARYYSFYIEGLRRLIGPSNLKYTTHGFPAFGQHCLALRIHGADESRVYLHSDDLLELSPVGLKWCDVFGKVNIDPQLVPSEHRSKVFPLGPTFAVRAWPRFAAEARGLANYVMSPRGPNSFRAHIANYRGQYKSRFPEHEYHSSVSDPSYIFFNAAIWEREPDANRVRARFVEAARQVDGVSFEGGLTPRKSARGAKSFDGSEFSSYLCERYPPDEYLQKSRRSAVVLNNPAYLDCHSWRLAEGLALGKAIISTPIIRPLTAPLEHGQHVHYVDGSVESFALAIGEICSDHSYRARLESGARDYYETYLSPHRVMQRVFRHAGVNYVEPPAQTG